MATLANSPYALVNSVASRFSGEQVALGIVSNNQLAVWAVSGTDRFKASSRDYRYSTIDGRGSRFAFKYRLPAGRSVAQAEVDAHFMRDGVRVLQSAVCSIPLMANDQCIAILSIRRNRRMGF